ncbi:MAG: enoyl-CoA hydratase [Robiginitomaculum sp.]|nr:MAG: enoyl-CoA hydratase [Robiginitomaculum sp.]
MTNHILVSDKDRVRTISFNRPDKKNALTRAMYTTIAEAMESADKDPGIRVIVFKGVPECFTSGNDMVDFQIAATNPEGREAAMAPVKRFLDALITTKTPMVSIVDGLAVGVGVTMLLHCDLVYCSKRASFQTPFTALGLVPEAASSQIMPAVMGHQQAAELLLLSKKIDAKTALRLGFVTRVFKTVKLDKKAAAEIKTLSELPPSSVRMAKALMRRAPESLTERMDVEGREFSARLSSEEFIEAASAFMSRRKPDFSKFE